MRLQPGDMQFVYNHSLLHDRTAYEDDSAARRHLMRVWLALPSDRPLPECYASRYGSIEVGNRGGVWVMSNDEQNTAENTPVARKAAGAAA
jgi:Taurine catabolism dioxygenase TauD, TfdA family